MPGSRIPSGAWLKSGLACVVAVPLVYFAAQALAAPWLPGFDPLRHTASQLGSDLSHYPAVLNAGAIATGGLALIGAPALVIALVRARTARAGAWLAGLALASTGIAAVWAGLHPLPDPRHNPGALGAGLFVLPLLLPALTWRRAATPGLRAYFAANLAAFAALALVLAGMTPVDPSHWPGLWQRSIAAVLHGPTAAWAGVQLWRGRR